MFPHIFGIFPAQKMVTLPCTEYYPLFDHFFGTVDVTWSNDAEMQQLSEELLAQLLCLYIIAQRIFTEHVTPE